MGPLTVINGILLGSCVSIAFSLAAVLLMFLVVGKDDPQLAHEFPKLVGSLLIFLCMTAISGTSFYLLIRRHRARWIAQSLLWVGVLATGCYYWP
ncbi:MAG TPA: hypothetical protein VLB07_09455 [Woeseiaceae bacterium]|nr:hypothetical protein [Woeseiaceae bacterium]